MKKIFANKGRKMWAVIGSSGGIHGFFDSKWKAKDAIECLWNIKKPNIMQVWIKFKNATTYEITRYSHKIIHD